MSFSSRAPRIHLQSKKFLAKSNLSSPRNLKVIRQENADWISKSICKLQVSLVSLICSVLRCSLQTYRNIYHVGLAIYLQETRQIPASVKRKYTSPFLNINEVSTLSADEPGNTLLNLHEQNAAKCSHVLNVT